MQEPSAVANRTQVEVAIAVVFEADHHKVLICQRKADAVLGGYWEFPGGKCEPGEDPAACACREVREETGPAVRIVRRLDPIAHDYPHARVCLHPFVCELVGSALDLQLLEVAAARWIEPQTAPEYRFPEANLPLVQAIGRGYDALMEMRSSHCFPAPGV